MTNINEVWEKLPPKPWAYWVLYAANRAANVSDLGLEPAGLTKDKDAVELFRSTVCPPWAGLEAGGVEEQEASRSSGGALPDEVRKMHKKIWGQGEWYERDMGGMYR